MHQVSHVHANVVNQNIALSVVVFQLQYGRPAVKPHKFTSASELYPRGTTRDADHFLRIISTNILNFTKILYIYC